MKNKNKINLIIYLLFTIISFLILVIPYAKLGMTLFILFQIISIVLLLPKSKALFMLIPIFLIGIMYTISENQVWEFTNLIFMMIMLSVTIMLTIKEFDFSDSLFGFIKKTLNNIFTPLNEFDKPFIWAGELFKHKDERHILKRVLSGIFIAIPFLIIILILLSRADMIFSHAIEKIFDNITYLISFSTCYRIFFSAFLGLYLFSVLYSSLSYKKKEKILSEIPKKGKDTLILNIFIGLILVIYTIFVIIQVRYLFYEGRLPYGFTYAEYARKGFFELLVLTGLNIVIMLFSIDFKHVRKDLSGKINNAILYYLCTMTIMLLFSSFYRMILYSNEYGLTRLRLYVFGFLVFEFIGLLITYFYIKKPKFNIVFIYSALMLTYYVLLNITPTDYIIANNLLKKYKEKPNFNISYIMTLSLDAAPVISELLDDTEYNEEVIEYFDRMIVNDKKWQEFNISYEKAKKIKEKIDYKF